MKNNAIEIAVYAKDLASGVLAGIKKSTDSLATSMADSLGGAIKKTGGLILDLGKAAAIGGAGGLLALGGAALQSASQIEATQLKYKVILGSAEAAVKRAKELADFAAKTPFRMDEISQADIILQNFGIRSTKLLTTIGDAAAISGSSFSDLALIMGQLSQSKGLDNIKQLAERGIVSFNELSKAGIQFAKDGSIVNSVEETYSKVVGIIEKKFAGGMDELSNTLPGKISTLMDNIGLKLGEFAQKSGLLDFAKEVVGQVGSIIEGIDIEKTFASVVQTFNDVVGAIRNFGDGISQVLNNPAVKEFFRIILSSFKDALLILQKGFGDFVAKLNPLREALDKLFQKLQPVFQVLGLIAGIFAGALSVAIGLIAQLLSAILVTALNLVVEAITWVVNAISTGISFFMQLAGVVDHVINTIIFTVTHLPEVFTAVFNQVKSVVENIFMGVFNFVLGIVDKIRDAISGFFSFATTLPGNLLNVFKEVINGLVDKINKALQFSINILGQEIKVDLPDLPKFAKGGDFETRGPQLIMVGDNPGGREKVQITPTSSANINGPKGEGINITVNEAQKMDVNQLASLLAYQIKFAR